MERHSYSPADRDKGCRVPGSSPPSLSIVIPVYNEARSVELVLERVLAQYFVAEVVAVDDGSTDGSWGVMRGWEARDGRVRLARHERNRGKGAAVRTGLALATAPVVVVQDADLEYDPADLGPMLELILSGKADVVYGSRYADGRRGVGPLWHTLGNKALTLFSNLCTGLWLSDEATCYKMFRRELVPRLELREEGFGFCPEFTAKVSRLGLRVMEVPITYHGRSRAEGKKIRLRHGVEALWCLVKYSRWRPTAGAMGGARSATE
ncbi:glycosyltransferase family 2 protein [Fontisphaera persica]|uniref:glycosyltransferase family 2 protein n=1 Tax=Fontisphaera persica TaxID=2974023 RepID=UPI0024BF3A14|nr:glycosyltransferase family 2 protein [Fontisphaera persica]WCJ59543.1 glycosyltransferase family 2 protein [Fontisphaera persica]